MPVRQSGHLPAGAGPARVVPRAAGMGMGGPLVGERAGHLPVGAVRGRPADPGDVELLYELGVAHFLPKDNALQEQLKAFVREYVRCLETGEQMRTRSARKSFTTETG